MSRASGELLSTGDGPLSGLAVYTLFGGDPVQLLQWCNFHLSQGADRLYVGLDRPAPETVAALPSHPRVQWRAFHQETWDAFYSREGQNVERKQVDGFRLAARDAAREGRAYLAFVDTDELINLSQPFVDLVARFPQAPVLRLPVREMWFAEGGDVRQPFGATVAVSSSGGGEQEWLGVLGWRAQYLRRGWLGHDAGKSIYRLPLVGGDISVHAPLSAAAAARAVRVPPESGVLLHFDCGSVNTWSAKWGRRLDGGTVATGLGPHRRAQLALFAHELRRSAEEQEAFFRRFFTLSQDVRELLAPVATVELVQVLDQIGAPLSVASTGGGADSRPVAHRALGARADMQVATVCDHACVSPAIATMGSVLAQLGERSGRVRFVVLGDGLSDSDVARLRALEHVRDDVEVQVHDITADLDSHLGQGASRRDFGRLYLVDHLPEQRTLYLDTRVVANRDVTALFELDLGDACIAGVPEVATADGAVGPLDARVLLLDLDAPDFRALALYAKTLGVLAGRAVEHLDRDVVERAFTGRVHRLPATYNHRVHDDAAGQADAREPEDEAAIILNFSGPVLPWEADAPEHCRALYRTVVIAAERQLQVDCGFGFSLPAPPARRSWSAERWAGTFRARATTPQAPPALAADVELVDLCDSGAYLRLWPAMYQLAVAADLRLSAVAGGQTLFEVPLSGLGPHQMDLIRRVGPQVRKLPFDLVSALAPRGGVVTAVHLALTGPDGHAHDGYERHLEVADVLAAGPAARPDLLPSRGVDGEVESVAGGWLTGWCRSGSARRPDPVSLYFGDELVARRAADLPRPDLAADGLTRGFRFNLAKLAGLGYSGDVGVRVSGSNIPLRGAALPLADALRSELRHDPVRGTWTKVSENRQTVIQRVRGRLNRMR